MSEAELAHLATILTEDPGLPRDDPTQAYWQQEPHALATVQSTSLSDRTDVAVIGSGITGANVTKTLLERHASHKVTVFEARTLCSGATGRNGGQLAINAAERYLELRDAVGAETAGKIIRFNLETLRRLGETAREISAEYTELTKVVKLRSFKDEASLDVARKGIVALETDHPAFKGLYEVLDAKRCGVEHGVHGVAGGIRHTAGTIWPYRFVTKVFESLLRSFSSRLAIEANTPVTAVKYDPTQDSDYPYSIHTPRGVVRAAQVAYCTNAYTGHLLPALRGPLFPLKGTMTVQHLTPPSENQGSSTSWAIHYKPYQDPEDRTIADGLIYGMQNVHTGDYFFGGEKALASDMLSADDTTISPSSVGFLQRSLLSLFGRNAETTEGSRLVSTWSGAMCFSADEMPLVGRLPSSISGNEGNGEWICAAYSGYGMPIAWLAGESLGAMILGLSPSELLPEVYLLSEARLAERLTVAKSVERISK
ncbi:FAD dependent oxidoreductase [Aspergillus karnatakaensis]|uniref:NAD(P)/FAD-dependent oxidoreductase n=1 Tax=Aspergillus karnatakaensis TaxID=1810916 RepID=UPI003CCCBC27